MNTLNIKYYEQLSSTNEYAMSNIAEIANKTIIVAAKQISGYGRFKRKWLSANEDNLYASIVLKPDFAHAPNSFLANFTQYFSVILCETFEKYDVNAEIKWPNDVLIKGKKIAGILSETSFQGQNFKGLVLGFGINLNMTQAELDLIDQPATALNIEKKQKIDKQQFLETLLTDFFADYEKFLLDGFAFIKSRYVQKCSFIGKEILVKNLDKEQSGLAIAINNDGSLQIQNDKKEYKILMGDMTC